MNIIESASQFIQSGISVIPIKYQDKRPDFRRLPLGDDGKPTWEPYKKQLPEPNDLANWFQDNCHNYGVVAGWKGLTVIDFDDIGAYNTWQMWAMQIDGITRWVASQAYRVSTSRGMHVYIRLPHREKNRKLPGIDIKGDGYVLGPGSVHPSGAIYTPMREIMNIPVVNALSDVLPATLLLSNQQVQTYQASSVTHVWTVSGAGQAPGKGLVSKIRANYRIEDFFPQTHRSGGHWLMTSCPLHDDQHPSFWIDTQKQICNCFSMCSPLPMDVINLFARINGLNNRDAILEMGKRL